MLESAATLWRSVQCMCQHLPYFLQPGHVHHTRPSGATRTSWTNSSRVAAKRCTTPISVMPGTAMGGTKIQPLRWNSSALGESSFGLRAVDWLSCLLFVMFSPRWTPSLERL